MELDSILASFVHVEEEERTTEGETLQPGLLLGGQSSR